MLFFHIKFYLNRIFSSCSARWKIACLLITGSSIADLVNTFYCDLSLYNSHALYRCAQQKLFVMLLLLKTLVNNFCVFLKHMFYLICAGLIGSGYCMRYVIL